MEKIQYGIHIVLINILKLVILFITAYFLGILKYTIIAFASFAILRTFASGIHASSSIKCIITNYIIFFGNVYLSLSFSLSKPLIVIIFTASLILVILYAPADTGERPLISLKLRRGLKIKSILVIILLCIVAIQSSNRIYMNLIIFSIFQESILITPMIYAIFKKKYKNYKSFEN